MKTTKPNTVIDEKLTILKKEFPAIEKYFHFDQRITEVKVQRIDDKLLKTEVERTYLGSLDRRFILIGNDGNFIIQIGWQGFAKTSNPLKLLWRWFNGNGVTFNESIAEGIVRAGAPAKDVAYIAEKSWQGSSFIIHKKAGSDLLNWAKELIAADIEEFKHTI